MTSVEDAHRLAEVLVGPCQLVADHSWANKRTRIVEITTPDGHAWFVKVFDAASHYERELHAYTHWVPAIADRAPTVRASDDAASVLVVSKLEGAVDPTLTGDDNVAMHRDAGRVLRRFHDAAAPSVDPNAVQRRIDAYRTWVEHAPEGLVDPGDLAFVEESVQILSSLPPLLVVPTHGDWQPRNWVVHRGAVGVVDFELAEPAWWTRDLERLWWAEWLDHPELRDAFLDGYGRDLTDLDTTVLMASSALGAVTTIVWGERYGDPGFSEHGRGILQRIR